MLYDTDSDGALTREELNSLLRTLDLLSAFLLPYSELTFLIREVSTIALISLAMLLFKLMCASFLKGNPQRTSKRTSFDE